VQLIFSIYMFMYECVTGERDRINLGCVISEVDSSARVA